MTESISDQFARLGDMDLMQADLDRLQGKIIRELREIEAQRTQLMALAQEVANHLYTKQDIDRCRDMARAVIRRATGPVPSTTGRNESTAGKRP